MLMLLFVLSIISFGLVMVLPIIQKKDLGKLYTFLMFVQSGAIGAMFGLLAVIIFKGRTLG